MRLPIRLLVPPAALLLAAGFPQRSVADPSVAAAYVPPPLALYGQLPSIEEPALSPAGDRLAAIRRQNGDRYIVISNLATGKQDATVRIGDAKVRTLRWYDDDRLLILSSTTAYPPVGLIGDRNEWVMLTAWDIAANRMWPVDMHDNDHETMNVVTGSLEIRSVDNRPRLFVSGAYITSQVLPALFEIDLQGGETRLVARADTLGAEWAVDAEGHVAASFEYQVTGAGQGHWVLRFRRGLWMRQVAAGDDPVEPPHIIGFSYDGKAVLVAFDTSAGRIWKPLRLADDTWGPPLGAGKSFIAVIRSRLTGRVIGGVQDPLRPRQLFFDPALQSRWSAVIAAYSGERVEFVSCSDDFTRFLIRVFGPRDGDSYVLVDWHSGESYRIGAVYHGLSTFAQVQPLDYDAADGLPLTGFLTLPPGKPPKNLSLIVLPHGGPAATDGGDFDWWAQALASRGYAVLQVNYRGSDTTPALLHAGFGEWGRKMQTDLSDGVRYLVERGIADPKHVCIVGGSYGGYAALAGVTLQTGIYRCAVSVAGVADLASFLRWNDERMGASSNESTHYWDRFLGVKGPKDPALEAISPIDHVAAVSVPILLVHGRDDVVVPYDQSEEMAEALRRAGKSVQFVTLSHEDHWLSRSATREQMLDSVVGFLERNDPPG